MGTSGTGRENRQEQELLHELMGLVMSFCGSGQDWCAKELAGPCRNSQECWQK